MNEHIREKVDAMIADYGTWMRRRRLSGCRWVQYIGVELTGASDVPLDQVTVRLTNAIKEGFHVGWAAHQGRLYVRVWEGGDEPPWDKVFAEQSLVDVADILRRAGFP